MDFFDERGHLCFGHSDDDGKTITGRIKAAHHFRALPYELDRLTEGEDATVYGGGKRSDGEACNGFGPDALFRKRPGRGNAGCQ
jgi:hypothetical protein